MDQNRYAFWPNAEDNFLAAFTGVRYLLSKSGDLDSSKYELMQQFGGIYLYRNVQEAATARFYVNTISEDSLKELCNEENRETLLENSLALEDGREIEDLSDLEEISEEVLRGAECTGERFLHYRNGICPGRWLCTVHDPL